MTFSKVYSETIAFQILQENFAPVVQGLGPLDHVQAHGLNETLTMKMQVILEGSGHPGEFEAVKQVTDRMKDLTSKMQDLIWQQTQTQRDIDVLFNGTEHMAHSAEVWRRSTRSVHRT
eukprot:CAMPEP_0169151592 /NCGR_PEP_ID=MMETSP1015-20121227/50941_1 /TAXON_ID=342587 /ORGANISM="Karlodinium micrum, Strain CCMP2283" /LENGTH=117 /DNA_ID=CAMNT_0009221087 /DNA_START=297 /DNA_END=650 /DNA_ORIENTATION=+